MGLIALHAGLTGAVAKEPPLTVVGMLSPRIDLRSGGAAVAKVSGAAWEAEAGPRPAGSAVCIKAANALVSRLAG